MLNVNIKESDWPDGGKYVTQDRMGTVKFWSIEPSTSGKRWVGEGVISEQYGAAYNPNWKSAIIARQQEQTAEFEPERKHNHYYKDVRHLDFIDVYRVMELYEVTDPCLQHAGKKIIVSGKRGIKDQRKDVQEAIDTLQRWIEMQDENEHQEKR